MKLVIPGSEFACFLGADERVLAKYEMKRYDDDSAGLTGGSRRLNRTIVMDIKSDLEEELSVTVKGWKCQSIYCLSGSKFAGSVSSRIFPPL